MTDRDDLAIPDAHSGDAGPVGIVARVVAVLRALAEAEGSVAIKQLAARLDLPPSTLHRILDQLSAAGMIERAPRRRYRTSAEFAHIGALAARRAGVLRLAGPALQQVAAATGETALLGVLLPRTLSMMFVDKADALRPVCYPIRLHQPRSMLWGATGLCILAWLDAGQVARVLARRERSPIDRSPGPDPQHLADRLARIRARGYAITFSEQTSGAVGIAAPVFGPDGRVVGDLCITVPDARFSAAHEPGFASVLKVQAAQLSRTLAAMHPAAIPEAETDPPPASAGPLDFHATRSRARRRLARGINAL